MTTAISTTNIPFTGMITGLAAPDLACLPPEEDVPASGDTWVKGHLSSKGTDELASLIATWSGCNEDLILMVMIFISKNMDQQIKAKAEEVLKLRQENEKKKGPDKNTEALDQAVQELQQMQKQRDQFFQMMQKILDGLTSSTDRLLQSWK